MESNKAAKLPLTILGVTALFGPIWLNKRLDPKEGFFSLISEKRGFKPEYGNGINYETE